MSLLLSQIGSPPAPPSGIFLKTLMGLGLIVRMV